MTGRDALKKYIIEFRRLSNRSTEVGPILLKSCFLRRLKRELKYDVKLLRPFSVNDAIAIDVQIDAKLNDLKPIASGSVSVPKSQPLILLYLRV